VDKIQDIYIYIYILKNGGRKNTMQITHEDCSVPRKMELVLAVLTLQYNYPSLTLRRKSSCSPRHIIRARPVRTFTALASVLDLLCQSIRGIAVHTHTHTYSHNQTYRNTLVTLRANFITNLLFFCFVILICV